MWVLAGALAQAPALAAEVPGFEPFPADVLLQAAAVQQGEPPASEPPEGPAIERLSADHQRFVRKFVGARKLREASFIVGMVSAAATLAGVGALRRYETCVSCGEAWRVGGIGLLAGGVAGIEVGAVTGLVGVGRERRALVQMGGGLIPANGLISGWSLMASQIFLPGFGAAGAYGGIGGQAMINDGALRRLRR